MRVEQFGTVVLATEHVDDEPNLVVGRYERAHRRRSHARSMPLQELGSRHKVLATHAEFERRRVALVGIRLVVDEQMRYDFGVVPLRDDLQERGIHIERKARDDPIEESSIVNSPDGFARETSVGRSVLFTKLAERRHVGQAEEQVDAVIVAALDGAEQDSCIVFIHKVQIDLAGAEQPANRGARAVDERQVQGLVDGKRVVRHVREQPIQRVGRVVDGGKVQRGTIVDKRELGVRIVFHSRLSEHVRPACLEDGLQSKDGVELDDGGDGVLHVVLTERDTVVHDFCQLGERAAESHGDGGTEVVRRHDGHGVAPEDGERDVGSRPTPPRLTADGAFEGVRDVTRSDILAETSVVKLVFAGRETHAVDGVELVEAEATCLHPIYK